MKSPVLLGFEGFLRCGGPLDDRPLPCGALGDRSLPGGGLRGERPLPGGGRGAGDGSSRGGADVCGERSFAASRA